MQKDVQCGKSKTCSQQNSDVDDPAQDVGGARDMRTPRPPMQLAQLLSFYGLPSSSSMPARQSTAPNDVGQKLQSYAPHEGIVESSREISRMARTTDDRVLGQTSLPQDAAAILRFSSPQEALAYLNK
eukprot:TRINITY_DN64215_c0_g1_i1.p1 TRINITY_DN64215_c0_g1~~TRINITY_DN64215_c0_g1_i1.p1  ORF type:complete len:128 (+),score=11.66 TRINITY_DN64215_c0_g1_i1:151-534(+)